jgi:hypothetical protein
LKWAKIVAIRGTIKKFAADAQIRDCREKFTALASVEEQNRSGQAIVTVIMFSLL